MISGLEEQHKKRKKSPRKRLNISPHSEKYSGKVNADVFCEHSRGRLGSNSNHVHSLEIVRSESAEASTADSREKRQTQGIIFTFITGYISVVKRNERVSAV